MANLTEILNDCIDRLAAGQSVQDCLAAYPDYASDLYPMLETGLLARRVSYAPAEVGDAHYRVRAQVLQAVASKQKVRILPLRGLTTMAASLLIIFFAAYVLVGFGAESSLPGESLYPIKRFNENMRLWVSGNDESLQQQFAQRRVDEIEQLLEQGQTADVEFKGTVEAIGDTAWQVASLTVQISASTQQDAGIEVGDSVQLEGRTTEQSQLVASAITLLEKGTPDQAPEPTPSLPANETPPVISTPSLLITPHEPEPTPEAEVTPTPEATEIQPPIPTEEDETETPEASETPDDDEGTETPEAEEEED